MTSKTNPGGIGAIIANVLESECAARRITYSDLAKKAGMSETTVADIFDGAMEINVAELTALAIALGSTPSVFVKRAEQIRGEVA